MPISFDCACGRHFSVSDEYAGKRTKCPSCAAPLVVPVPDVPATEPAFDEDAAFRALMESPDPEPRSAPARSPSPRETDADEPPARGSSVKALSSRKAAKFTKPSTEERAGRKERRSRGNRTHDPDRGRKILYMIGGVLMILGGIGVVALAFEGGAIRTGVFGGFLAFGGVGTLFQGLTGNFDDDA